MFLASGFRSQEERAEAGGASSPGLPGGAGGDGGGLHVLFRSNGGRQWQRPLLAPFSAGARGGGGARLE